MNYFYFEEKTELAIEMWNSSQFDLCDVVLSLTDQGIVIGGKLYSIFSKPEILYLMKYFVCDFMKIKQDLGIVGNYVDRSGNIYSKDFNPKRNIHMLSLSSLEMAAKAKDVYKKIMRDLDEIAYDIASK